jgi:hypothetical protein
MVRIEKWASPLVYKEVAGKAGRRILACGNDAKDNNEIPFSAHRLPASVVCKLTALSSADKSGTNGNASSES